MITPEHNPQCAAMLVDISALYDMRLGTIAKFGKEAYVKALAGGYYSRRSEHFEGIDPVKYHELYRERDAVTLSMSMITNIVSLIKDFVTRVNVVSATAPVKKTPRVDINVWPLNPPKRVMDLILKALQVHIADRVDLGYVRYSPEDMHYDLIKHTYDHLIMYELGPWLSAQAEDWARRNKGLPDVTVFFPMLHRGMNKEEIPEDITMMADDFAREIAPILNPMQLPIQFFCSVLDPWLLRPKEPGDEAPSSDEGVEN